MEHYSCSVTSSPQQFGNCLSNFQLKELLVLKKSMERMDQLVDDYHAQNASCENPQEQQPQRMALMAAERGDHSSYSGSSGSIQSWHNDHAPAWTEPKPSKLQTLFQISITALAFLSFGGYLLCLIVQAIKSKGTTYFHPVATATTTTNNGNVKRIKIYRRSKRQAYNEPHVLLQDYASYMSIARGRQLDYAHLVGS